MAVLRVFRTLLSGPASGGFGRTAASLPSDRTQRPWTGPATGHSKKPNGELSSMHYELPVQDWEQRAECSERGAMTDGLPARTLPAAAR